MKRSSVVLLTGLLLALLPLFSCTDLDPVGPDLDPSVPDFSGNCTADGGTVRRGSVSGTWTRNGSPHRVEDTVYVSGGLLIEAGALVCLGPDAAISWRPGTAGTVRATGTAEAPVVFTADRPGGRWGGFVYRDPNPLSGTAAVDLTHVVIENATTGIDLGYGQSARVTDGLIRRITGPGVYAGGIQLRNVVVDSVCQGGGSCTAVSAFNYASVFLEHVWIKDSGGGGVGMGDRGTLTLADVRITGSAGTGLYLSWPPGRFGELGGVVHPIQITGGHGQPASLPASVVRPLLPDLEAQERWTGNAHDVVSVYHSGSLGDLVVGPGLAWALSTEEFGPSVSHLTMLPGARFTGGSVGRFTAEGTSEHPIVIQGTVLHGGAAGPSRIVHGRLWNVIVNSWEAHALEMSNVLVENGYVSLDASGSRLERVFVRGVIAAWPADPFLSRFSPGETPTEALRIGAANVSVSGSEISHSPSDGVRVEVAAGVRLWDSNIEHNVGVGLRNVAAELVDARDNWWGDPEGPLGAEGDGVEGGVDFEPFRTTPMTLDAPVPRTLVLTPTARVVPVGDTVYFTAMVLDGGGVPLWADSLEWRSSDTAVVVVAGIGRAGRVTGVTEGTVEVTVEVQADTTLRQTATVQVVAGAPPYQWKRLDLDGQSMWGSAESGLYVSAGAGIHHYDGSQWALRWSLQEIGSGQVRGVGGLAGDELWAIGHDASSTFGRSALFRWDGSTWHRMPAPFAHGERLWVAAPNRVYVVSRDSEPDQGLWYYDGANFRQLLGEPVWGLWGRSPTDVFVGTSAGTLHFDGTTWRNTGEPAAHAFWGTADQIFSVSGSGMYRYDGAGWERIDCEIPYATMMQGIWGTSPSDIYVAGNYGVVRHYDGSRCWTVWLGTEGFAAVSGLGSEIVIGGWSDSYHGSPWQ